MAYDSTWREAPKTAIIRVVGATALGIALGAICHWEAPF